MALQTREQHIKRDRATSNICTAQVLLAVMAGMYAVYHGPQGLKFIASKINTQTKSLYNALDSLGLTIKNNSFFDTLHIEADVNKIKPLAEAEKVNFYYPDNSSVVIAINETTNEDDLKSIISILKSAQKTANQNEHYFSSLPHHLERQTDFMTSEIFNTYHSETELMRYIKRLERKDLSLNHSMISLGSCTMKLNAASEMLPLSWPKWGNIHPSAPKIKQKDIIKF